VTLRIFVDENMPGSVVRQLRSDGHDVSWGCEFDKGVSDVVRAAGAAREGRVILTEDNDFASIVSRDRLPVVGLVLIELHGFGRDARAARIVAAMRDIGPNAVGKVHVVAAAKIRARDLP
jgi:predicted nuclease of predicted toxin-antitoxin system